MAIKVGAIFKGSNILPKWFIADGIKHAISKVNYMWQDRAGREKLFFFSVTDEHDNTYELCFNSEQTVWRMTKS